MKSLYNQILDDIPRAIFMGVLIGLGAIVIGGIIQFFATALRTPILP